MFCDQGLGRRQEFLKGNQILTRMITFILDDRVVQVLDLIHEKVIVHDRTGMTTS